VTVRILCRICAAASALLSQPQGGPARTFANRCTICHGADANRSDRAPGILGFVASHSNEEVAQLVRTGQLDRGMPHFAFNDEEMRTLQTYLRGLIAGTVLPQAGRGGGGRGGLPRFQPRPAMLQLEDGRTLSGTLTSLDRRFCGRRQAKPVR